MSGLWAEGTALFLHPLQPHRPPLHHPTLNAASISTPSWVLWATASLVPPSCPRCAVAPTNSSLGSDPGQAQVEDDSPDVQHAADLGGQREGPAISVWAPGVGWSHTGSPAPLSENQPNTEGRELFRVQTLVKKKKIYIYREKCDYEGQMHPASACRGGRTREGSTGRVALTITPFTHPKRTGSGAGALPGSPVGSSSPASIRPLLRCGSDTGTWRRPGSGCRDNGDTGEGGQGWRQPVVPSGESSG